jgi:hypothetical protein
MVATVRGSKHPRGMLLVTHAFASSEHAWDPIASSSAKSRRKTSTVPPENNPLIDDCSCIHSFAKSSSSVSISPAALLNLANPNRINNRIGMKSPYLQCCNMMYGDNRSERGHPKGLLWDHMQMATLQASRSGNQWHHRRDPSIAKSCANPSTVHCVPRGSKHPRISRAFSIWQN